MQGLKAPSYREEKVCRLAKEQLAEIFRREISDPRLRHITVTQIRWNKRADLMKIGVCRLPEDLGAIEPTSKTEVLEALKSAQSFIFENLRKRIAIRRFPSLRFEYDDSLDEAAKVWKKIGQWEQSPERSSG